MIKKVVLADSIAAIIDPALAQLSEPVHLGSLGCGARLHLSAVFRFLGI